MISVEAARALILQNIVPLGTERGSWAEIAHRILREEICADTDLPSFDRSAMDGYAVLENDPATQFSIVTEITPGSARPAAWQPGECARIFTGAALPPGDLRVLPQEDVIVRAGKMEPQRRSASRFIRQRGEDARQGDMLMTPGTKLGAAEMAVLASVGAVSSWVTRRPRVVHFATGDELVPPDQVPLATQIRDTNSILLRTLLEQDGAHLVHHARVTDEAENFFQQVAALDPATFDLLLISGGASVGDYDAGRITLERLGFSVVFSQLNLRPGKPLIFATRGTQLAFVLPGNPVSHFVVYHLLIRHAVRALLGQKSENRFWRGTVDPAFAFTPNARETFWPAQAQWREDGFHLRPLRWQSSGDLRALVGVSALLQIPSHATALPEANFLWLQEK